VKNNQRAKNIPTKLKLLHMVVTVNIVPGSLIHFTLMMEAIRFSETSVLRRTMQRHIPEDDILHDVSYSHPSLGLHIAFNALWFVFQTPVIRTKITSRMLKTLRPCIQTILRPWRAAAATAEEFTTRRSTANCTHPP
jgi:hypothetical protein